MTADNAACHAQPHIAGQFLYRCKADYTDMLL